MNFYEPYLVIRISQCFGLSQLIMTQLARIWHYQSSLIAFYLRGYEQFKMAAVKLPFYCITHHFVRFKPFGLAICMFRCSIVTFKVFPINYNKLITSLLKRNPRWPPFSKTSFLKRSKSSD